MVSLRPVHYFIRLIHCWLGNSGTVACYPNICWHVISWCRRVDSAGTARTLIRSLLLMRFASCSFRTHSLRQKLCSWLIFSCFGPASRGLSLGQTLAGLATRLYRRRACCRALSNVCLESRRAHSLSSHFFGSIAGVRWGWTAAIGARVCDILILILILILIAAFALYGWRRWLVFFEAEHEVG